MLPSNLGMYISILLDLIGKLDVSILFVLVFVEFIDFFLCTAVIVSSI